MARIYRRYCCEMQTVKKSGVRSDRKKFYFPNINLIYRIMRCLRFKAVNFTSIVETVPKF